MRWGQAFEAKDEGKEFSGVNCGVRGSRYFGRYELLTSIGYMGMFSQAVFPIRGWFSRSRRQSVAVAVMIGSGHVSDAGVYLPSTAMNTGDGAADYAGSNKGECWS